MAFFVISFTILPVYCLTLNFSQTSKDFYLSLQEYNLTSGSYEINLIETSEINKTSLLTARRNLNPFPDSYLLETWNVTADLYDLDSWVSGSRSHSLQLSYFGEWFLGIFTFDNETSTEWVLTIKLIGNLKLAPGQCVNSCSNGGSCLSSGCDCSLLRAGIDCSIKILEGKIDKSFDLLISSHSYLYMLFNTTFPISCQVSKYSSLAFIYSKVYENK